MVNPLLIISKSYKVLDNRKVAVNYGQCSWDDLHNENMNIKCYCQTPTMYLVKRLGVDFVFTPSL